jgi:hypothetical protein
MPVPRVDLSLMLHRWEKAAGLWQDMTVNSLFLNWRALSCEEHLNALLYIQPQSVDLGSSVGIVSDYKLHDWVTGFRSLAGAKDFSSSLCVQTSSEAHPASYPMGIRGPFPGGVKRGRDVTLTTHPHLVPRSWMSRSYTSLPPSASMACRGTLLYFLLTYHTSDAETRNFG